MERAGATSGSAQKENEEDNASIQVQAKRLCMSIHAAVAEHARQKEEVEGERTQLASEKQRIQVFPVGRIKLDVGGTQFTASVASLCRVPGCMLEAMFSGRHTLQPEEGGVYFIDRDGTHFRFILNYLRTGAVSTPPDPASKQELAVEADYYCLDALARALRAPAMNLLDLLGQDVVEERAEEEAMRKAFAERAAQSLDTHAGLLSLFAQDAPEVGSFKREARMPLLADLRPLKAVTIDAPCERVAVPTLDAFRSNFSSAHANVLHRLGPLLATKQILIAGGSVLRALTLNGTRTSGWWGESGDVDIFLHSIAEGAEASALAKKISMAMCVDGEDWLVARRNGVIDLMQFWRNNNIGERSVMQTVQIVLRLYQSAAEILTGFDCDCICCGYDGEAVWALPRCLRALRTGVNLLNPLHAWPNRPAYELRLGKYATRGWPIGVPGLTARSVDHDKIRQSQLADLHGLGRLLKVAHTMDASRVAGRGYHGCNLPKDSTSRNGPLERVPMPGECRQLREPWVDGLSELEQCVRGIHSYDDGPSGVLIPRAYDDGPTGALSQYDFRYFDNMEEMSGNFFNRVWSEIADSQLAGRSDIENIPRLLEDAWSDGQRSREYLNAELDPMTLTSQYYTHAYIDDRM